MDPQIKIENEILVKECIKGNPDALGIFYTRYAPRMYSVISRYVSNPRDAEDILHDGFIVAFTRLNTLRNHESVEYWLATIMKNLSLKFLQEQDVVGILHDIPEVEDSPEFTDIIDISVLESLIKKLPKGYQTVFRLSVLENKTHKEIAEILGIAPNSSSSQLFHATLLMRKLITEYRHKTELLSLLLIVLSVCILRWLHITDSTNTVIPKFEYTAEVTERRDTGNTLSDEAKRGASSLPSHNRIKCASSPGSKFTSHLQPKIIPASPAEHPVHNPADTTGNRPSLAENKDTILSKPSKENPSNSFDEERYAFNDSYPTENYHKHRLMSLKIGASSGVSISNIFAAKDLAASPGDPPQEPQPDKTEDEKMKNNVQKIRRHKNYRNISHNNDLPVTVSASIYKPLSRVSGIETGLSYTYLHSTLEWGGQYSDCRWHYLGIPVKLTFNNLSTKRVRLYASAGAQLDIPLYCSATNNDKSVDRLPDGRFHSPVVWSCTVNYGINFNISDRAGIFVEPSVQYHFNHDYLIPNVWTDNKFSFSLPIGLRFNF